MQAVLLAAGHSTRFEPFTSLPHKAMVKIMGKTILEHTLLSIKNAGITDIILVISEDSVISDLLPTGHAMGINLKYVIHTNAKGMGAALLDAGKYITDDFFLLTAYHVDFDQFAGDMIKKRKNEKDIVLLGKKPHESNQFGVMEINGEKVTAVVEKPEKVLDHQLQIIGIYLLNNNFLNVLSSVPLDHYHFEKALDMYATQHMAYFLKTDKETVSLKFSWDILCIKNYLFQHMKSFVSPHATVSPHAVITGEVWIDEGSEIMDGAIIKGPCFIGKNVKVGNYAVLRNGIDLEEGSVIGARMEIKNSLVMQEATTHSGFIGDSIIGEKSKVAANICTANVRLDRKSIVTIVKEEKVNSNMNHLGMIVGENVHIGSRVSTMPGVIIGNNAVIGPTTTVLKNVKPDSKYYTRFQEVIESHEK